MRASRTGVGRGAELVVIEHLQRRGFVVMARNLRLGALELDVVARKDDLVVVVEVRTRGPGAMQGPFESIGGIKRVRLRRAVERLWRRHLKAMRDVQRVRIDVAAVTFDEHGSSVEYVEGAIE
jgi:putative endonuclease